MAVQLKEITVAHSPDSDDAFMFYALAKNKLDTHGLRINQVMKDIQSLNKDAQNGTYEVSAVSFAVYPLIADKYALMPCGASMGYKYGPIVVAREPITPEQLKNLTVAIPGELTTAWLTLRLFMPGLQTVTIPFNQILDAVADRKVDAGLLIHEGQLTYKDMGMHKIVDLGQWWFEQTGLPLPLGGNVIRRDLGPDLIRQTTDLLKKSIVYSLEHRREALEYALEYARDMDPKLADQFVGMYVNDLTVDFGEQGREALRQLFEAAYEKGILKSKVDIEFAS